MNVERASTVVVVTKDSSKTLAMIRFNFMANLFRLQQFPEFHSNLG